MSDISAYFWRQLGELPSWSAFRVVTEISTTALFVVGLLFNRFAHSAGPSYPMLDLRCIYLGLLGCANSFVLCCSCRRRFQRGVERRFLFASDETQIQVRI